MATAMTDEQVNALIEGWKNENSCVLVGPTGTGKKLALFRMTQSLNLTKQKKISNETDGNWKQWERKEDIDVYTYVGDTFYEVSLPHFLLDKQILIVVKRLPEDVITNLSLTQKFKFIKFTIKIAEFIESPDSIEDFSDQENWRQEEDEEEDLEEEHNKANCSQFEHL